MRLHLLLHRRAMLPVVDDRNAFDHGIVQQMTTLVYWSTFTSSW